MTTVAAWGLALGIVGGLLQIGGLIVAGLGVRKTSREYDPDHQDLVARLWARRPWAAPNRGTLDAALAIGVTFTASGEVGLSHKPESVAEDLLRLEKRTTELRIELDTFKRDHAAELKQLGLELAQTRGELEAQTQQQVKRLATEGLTQEAVGLGITAVGVIVALIGAVLAASGTY